MNIKGEINATVSESRIGYAGVSEVASLLGVEDRDSADDKNGKSICIQATNEKWYDVFELLEAHILLMKESVKKADE